MNPPSSYPTPPPPGIRSTSSSLAFALGPPLTYSNQLKTPVEHAPNHSKVPVEHVPNHSKVPVEHIPKRKEPAVVFNDFIAQKDREIQAKSAERGMKGEALLHFSQQLPQVAPQSVQSNTRFVVQQAIPSPQTHVPQSACSSTQVTPRSTIRPPPVPSPTADGNVTPRKRKFAEEVRSSPLKRVHTVPSKPQEELPVQLPSLPTTPSSRGATPRHVMAYVELPPLPNAWRTPSKKCSLTPSTSTRPHNADASGSEEDDLHYNLGTGVKSSARRTGDRDERGGKPSIDAPCLLMFLLGPLEKLSTLIEDIFEAEDSLAVDIDVTELPKEFFSVLTTDCSHPHLQPKVIKKLTKYLSQLARPTKRSRRSVRDSTDTPRVRKALGDIDSVILARLLKILERGIKAGEALDPLRASVHVPHADKMASPRKPKKSPRAQKVASKDRDVTHSGSLSVPEEDVPEYELETDSTDMPQELTESDIHDLSKQLEIARDSILAVECCVALLSGEGLTKQVCLCLINPTLDESSLSFSSIPKNS